jgi:hypothetical protein
MKWKTPREHMMAREEQGTSRLTPSNLSRRKEDAYKDGSRQDP